MNKNENNNQHLIDELDIVKQWLIDRPNLPRLCYYTGIQALHHRVTNKEELRNVAREIMPFTKNYGDYNLSMKHIISPHFAFNASIERDAVCNKIVHWDCPEDIKSILDLSDSDSEEGG